MLALLPHGASAGVPSAPTVVAPQDGSIITTNRPSFSGTTEPGLRVTVREGSTDVCTTTTHPTSGGWVCFLFVNLAEGAHTVDVQAVDGNGNPSPTTSITFTVDTHGPATPVISAPVQGARLNTRTPTFTGTAEARGKVTVREDSTVLCVSATHVTTGDWSCVSTVQLASGTRNVTATAQDTAGNWSLPAELALVVDLEPPLAPVLLSPLNGQFMNTVTPTFRGTAEAASTVTVRLGGVTVCSASTDASGAWSCTSGLTLAQGNQTVSITATDGVGNTSPSRTSTFSVDNVPPATPLVTEPTPGQAVGTANPTFSGTAEPGSTVAVYEGTRILCAGTARSAPDVWSCASAALTHGEHTISARAVDSYGNVSPFSASVTFTVDLQAPPAPLITAPTSGQALATTMPTLGGTAEAGATLTVRESSTVLCTTLAAVTTGQWSCTSAVLTQGVHSITATARDAVGNTGPASPAVSFTVDTRPPLAPLIKTPVSGAALSTATPLLRGSAEPGDIVTVSEGATVLCAIPAARVSGDWSCTSPLLSQGAHTLSATERDAAGNTSPVTPPVSFTVDTLAPDAPLIASPTSGQLYNTRSISLRGTAEPSSTVTVRDGIYTPCLTWADTTGAWDCVVYSPENGVHTLTATAQDAVRNTSAASLAVTFTVDTIPPAPPVILAPSPGQALATRTPTFHGKAEPGCKVSVEEDAVKPALCTTTADAVTGAWSCTTSPLADGFYRLFGVARDAAGNPSASPSVAITVDTTPPDAPSILEPTSAQVLATRTPTLGGLAEPGGIVTVKEGDQVLCIVTATSHLFGPWACTPASLADGAHTLSATVTDTAGNTSPASPPRTFTVDTTAPAAPVIDSPVDGAVLNTVPGTYSGTAERGSVVTFTVGGSTPVTLIPDDSGHWSSSPGLSLQDGDHTVTVFARDSVGNIGPVATSTFTLDTVAPDTRLSSHPPVLTNQTSATFTFSRTEDGGTGFVCTLDDVSVSCASPYLATNLGEGPRTFTVAAVDAAGNVDPTPARFTWTVDASAPDTFIRSAPPRDGASCFATFDLDSNEAPVTYECSLDGGAFAPCQAPAHFTVRPGPHTLAVRAVDGAANVDASPAIHAWTANPDSDGDGLPDLEEARLGTDPRDDDSDDDGLLDGTEDANHDGVRQDDETDALQADSDHGGVWDGIEDRDHNGRVDPGETDPLDASDDVDADGDGVDNAREQELGLDPFNPDTDGDGLTDGLDGLTDTDGDGFIDARDTDSDDDGLLDGEEDVDHDGTTQAHETDRRKADTDGDGVSDGAEVMRGTDPLGVEDKAPTLDQGCSTGGAGGLLPWALGLLAMPLFGRRRPRVG